MNEFNRASPVNKEISITAGTRNEQLLGNAIGEYKPGRSCDYRYFKFHCGHFQDVALKNYRLGMYSCQQCFKDKLNKVAESQGLELISLDVIRYSNERAYRRVACGHIEIKSNAYLEKHKISNCQECIDIEINENFKDSNFKILGRENRGCRVSCKICFTEYITSIRTAKEGAPFCDVCFEHSLQEDAKAAGFTYLKDLPTKRKITKSRTSVNRWYSCNTCNRVDDFGHVQMKRKNVRCDTCFNNRLQAEAAVQGMVHKGWHGGMLHTYELPCGCLREYNPFTVRKGIWACKTHGNTHYHRANGIYLVKFINSNIAWLKMGYAKDLDIRFKGYGLPEGTLQEVLFYMPVATGYEALEIEKSLHREFISFRLEPSEMKKLMSNTGHTECYPIQMEKELLYSLEKLIE